MSDSPSREQILRRNISSVLQGIREAAARAGRDPSEIRLLIASKKQGLGDLLSAYRLLKEAGSEVIFGESYVQEAESKVAGLPDDCLLHLIGPLQSNKIKKAISIFNSIQSVHKSETAERISVIAEQNGIKVPVCFEVNVSGDPGKSGFAPTDLITFARGRLPALGGLIPEGLMTITFNYGEMSLVRRDYRSMKALMHEFQEILRSAGAGSVGRLELSMGMSDDYQIAIEEGATMVRIGSAVWAGLDPLSQS